jgi:deoxycytidylate deaminase
MQNQISPPEIIITSAIKASYKSVCRSQRGVVIWKSPNIILAYGYNQLLTENCDQSNECKRLCAKNALHAEQDAIRHANQEPLVGSSMLHVKTVAGNLVVSEKPSCVECSKLILAFGISFMWLFQQDGWIRYTASEFHERSLAV